MATADSYTRFVAERPTPPPLTSGETLHWDGRSVASRGRELMPVAVPGACAGVPAQGRCCPETTQPTRHDTAARPHQCAPSTRDYVGHGGCQYDRVSGAGIPRGPHEHHRSFARLAPSVWVHQGASGRASLPAALRLLVQTASTTCQGACVEIVPHLPADDPLRHHMGLVLRRRSRAEGVPGRLYAATLSDCPGGPFPSPLYRLWGP